MDVDRLYIAYILPIFWLYSKSCLVVSKPKEGCFEPQIDDWGSLSETSTVYLGWKETTNWQWSYLTWRDQLEFGPYRFYPQLSLCFHLASKLDGVNHHLGNLTDSWLTHRYWLWNSWFYEGGFDIKTQLGYNIGGGYHLNRVTVMPSGG